MQFKVPQNIDMADRIVGPLTLVQFLYLLIAGIIVYFFFSTIAPSSFGLFLLLSIPIVLFALALTFLKVQDQTFGKFVRSFVVYMGRPKSRIWFKEGVDSSLIITPDKVEKSTRIEHKSIKKSELEKLITVLDTGGHTRSHADGAAHSGGHHPAQQSVGHHHKKTWNPPKLDSMRKK